MIKLLLLSLTVFLSTISFGQEGELYTTRNGFCSSSILLFKNGMYNCESGCEASSHFSYGTWTQKKDTIIFTQGNRRNLVIIKSVNPFKTQDSTLLTVKIFDQNGRNISDRIRIGQYLFGAATYPMEIDRAQAIQTVYRRNNGVIVLTSLQELFKQKLAIPIDSFNYFEITLNLSADWIYSPNSHWNDIGNFKMTKSKTALMSVELDGVEDGLPEKTIYALDED